MTRISTPGSTAALWSFTVPLICAVACADRVEHVKRDTRIPANIDKNIRFISLFLQGRDIPATDDFVCWLVSAASLAEKSGSDPNFGNGVTETEFGPIRSPSLHSPKPEDDLT